MLKSILSSRIIRFVNTNGSFVLDLTQGPCRRRSIRNGGERTHSVHATLVTWKRKYPPILTSNICMNASSNISMNTTSNTCMKTASNVCMKIVFKICMNASFNICMNRLGGGGPCHGVCFNQRFCYEFDCFVMEA